MASDFAVFLITGAQFAASLLSRLWSGSVSDRHGPKRAVSAALVMAVFAGLFYLIYLLAVHNPAVSVTILLVGRALRELHHDRRTELVPCACRPR